MNHDGEKKKEGRDQDFVQGVFHGGLTGEAIRLAISSI
jgi:hypothetical protein